MTCRRMSDQEFQAFCHESDEKLEALLRAPRRWSYVVRDPAGVVAAYGRGKTRAECERWAVVNAAAYATEAATWRWGDREWRFLIWPPAR